MTTNNKIAPASWGSTIKKINSCLSFEKKTLAQLAEQCQLQECTVRSFLPMATVVELTKDGEPVYILDSKPRGLKIRQAVELTLELARRFYDDPYVSAEFVVKHAAELRPGTPAESIHASLSQLYTAKRIDRSGFNRGSFKYASWPDGKTPPPSVRVSGKTSYAEMLMEVATFVETAEAKVVTLEKRNAELERELAGLKQTMRKALGGND